MEPPFFLGEGKEGKGGGGGSCVWHRSWGSTRGLEDRKLIPAFFHTRGREGGKRGRGERKLWGCRLSLSVIILLRHEWIYSFEVGFLWDPKIIITLVLFFVWVWGRFPLFRCRRVLPVFVECRTEMGIRDIVRAAAVDEKCWSRYQESWDIRRYRWLKQKNSRGRDRNLAAGGNWPMCATSH